MATEASKLTRAAGSRGELTAIAIDCFARYGFQGSSIERIASLAGVTEGAIYYHFRDKEDLLAAAVGDRIAEFEARVERACTGATPEEALRRIAEVCIEHARSDDRPRFIITLMAESIETNARVAAELAAMMRRFRAFLRNLVRRGQELGRFRADADPARIAAGYTSAMLGAEIQFYQDPENFPFDEAVTGYLEQLMSDLTTGSVTS